MQPEGKGDILKVTQKIKGVNERKELWSLPNNFVGNDPRWISAEIPITGENTQGFEYRVGRCIDEIFMQCQKN